MADRRRVPQFNALVASAAVLEADKRFSPRPTPEEDEAWKFYKEHGALYFGATWMANGISRARLVAADEPQDPGDEPAVVNPGDEDATDEQQAAAELVAGIAGGVGGQSSMLKSLTIHLTVPGRGYVVVEEDEDGRRNWWAVSADEVKVSSKTAVNELTGERRQLWELARQKPTDAEWRTLSPETAVVEVWRPDERYHWKADSPARHALPVLRRLSLCAAHVNADLTSRLTGAGIWPVPQELKFPRANGKTGPDAFQERLNTVGSQALLDPSSAAARMPMVVEVPGELIQYLKDPIRFATALDDRVLTLEERAFRQLAVTLDMPAEVLLGLGDTTHWNAWLIEESGLKMHAEPLLELICHAFTVGYLRPALKVLGFEEPTAMVWFDPSELTVRPDRSQNTIQAYDRSEVGGDTLRRELGLGEEDKPTPEELLLMAGLKLLGSPLTAPLGLEVLGIPVTGAPINALTGPAEPAPEGPSQGPPDTQGNPPPEPDQTPPGSARAARGDVDRLLPAAYLLTQRALEKAGNRLRSKLRGQLVAGESDCPPAHMHECVDVDACAPSVTAGLFSDAWANVDDVALACDVDAAWLAGRLDRYVHDLVASRRPLTWEGVREAVGG